MDMSGPYRRACREALPNAGQVADLFHVVQDCDKTVNRVRCRVHNSEKGRRGRRGDPLYQARKLLTAAAEDLSPEAGEKLDGLLREGDPHGEVRDVWHAKEALRETCHMTDPETAATDLADLVDILADPGFSPEINKLGRTIKNWFKQIVNTCKSKVSNGPTEAVNNLIKLVKRTAFGFTNFNNHKTRILLYAGKPNLTPLNTLTLP